MNFVSLPLEEAYCEICVSSSHEKKVASGWDFEYETTRDEYSFVRCDQCGLIYLKYRPQRDVLHIVYPQNYYSYIEVDKQNKLVKYFRNKLENKKIAMYTHLLGGGGKSIFDIGCGEGRLLDIIKNINNRLQLYGIEISDNAAKKAIAKGYEVSCGNIEYEDLSLLRNKFDLILIHQVIEHTRSPRKVIKQMHSVLKENGLVSIETPDTDSWDYALFKKRYWGGYHIPRHFYLFNKMNLRQLLKQEGFEIIHCKSLLSPVFWIHSLSNYLKEKMRTNRFTAFFNYQNPILLSVASFIDVLQILSQSSSSNMQIIARKVSR